MKLNSKGQVTIPAELRARHGLREGDEIDVVDVGGQLHIVLAGDLHQTRGQRLVGRLRGKATTGMSTDDLLGLLRAE